METDTKSYFLITAGIIILLIALIFFFSTNILTPSSAGQGKIFENCKTINYNGPGRINILFFAQKQDAQKYTDFFLGVEPFSENEKAFNFFYIDDYKPDCQLYKDIAIVCHSNELIQQASICPHDVIIVLDEKDRQIRSSAYLNVLSINSNHLLNVLIHEFGHWVANLAEEYINDQKPPRGSKNCVNECSEFEGAEDGCFEGCSLGSLQRSVNNGVMRTLNSADYGRFNIAVIQDAISEIVDFPNKKGITGQAVDDFVNPCQNQEFILFDADTGKKAVYKGCAAGTAGKGDYTYRVFNAEGELIFSDEFNADFFSDVQDEQAQAITGVSASYQEVGELLLTIPKQGDSIEVLNPDGETIIKSEIYSAGARPCLA